MAKLVIGLIPIVFQNDGNINWNIFFFFEAKNLFIALATRIIFNEEKGKKKQLLRVESAEPS